MPMLPGSAPRTPHARAHVHPTTYRYTGDADPSAPGGMAVIYKDLIADENQPAGNRRRHCSPRPRPELPRAHQLDRPPGDARQRTARRWAMTRSSSRAAWAPKPVLPPWPGCTRAGRPAAARRGHRAICRGRLRLPDPRHPVPRRPGQVERTARPVRRAHPAPPPRQATAEIHDYHDSHRRARRNTGQRAPGYTSLGFPDPRKLPLHPQRRRDAPGRPGVTRLARLPTGLCSRWSGSTRSPRGRVLRERGNTRRGHR